MCCPLRCSSGLMIGSVPPCWIVGAAEGRLRLRVHRRSLQILILVALGALVTIPNLGGTGLSSSEGHRVVPALEMLETGDWLVPRMFGQAYVRKPQGVFWVFAGGIALFRDPVVGARLMSAAAFVLTALGAWVFARRWFGQGAGLVSGCAVLLTPLYWAPARSAEIESLNNLATAIGFWITIELVRALWSRRASGIGWSVALWAAAIAMLLIKGPAGFPALGGVLIGGAVIGRSWRVLGALRIWIPVLVAGSVFAAHWSRTLGAAGEQAIVQSPDAFMFEQGQILKLLGFIPVSLVTALPMTLALLIPWGADERRERAGTTEAARFAMRTMKLVALGCLFGLLILFVSGVSNDRYAQPILIGIAPLVGGVLVQSGLARSDWAHRSLACMMPHRVRITRAMMLGGPKVMGSVLLVGALVFALVVEPEQRASSGRAPGIEAARAMVPWIEGGPVVVSADAMIDARPEILLAMRDELRSLGIDARMRWDPGLDSLPESGGFVLLRTDQGDEVERILGREPRLWRRVWSGRVHEFSCDLVQIELGPESGR